MPDIEYEAAGDLWMSDVMHGPKVREGARLRRTYLIAFVDDATRSIERSPVGSKVSTTTRLNAASAAKRLRKMGMYQRGRAHRRGEHPRSLPRRAAAAACSVIAR